MSQYEEENVCRVGYALNPKKLRKGNDSGKDATVRSDPSSSIHILSNSPAREEKLSPSMNNDHQKASTRMWRGGGLADIISAGVEIDGVQFIPWDYEVPLNQQVGFSLV